MEEVSGRFQLLLSIVQEAYMQGGLKGKLLTRWDLAAIDGQSEVISAVKTTLALDRDDPTKADAITALRKQTNDWVAKYRRDASFAGRPSYG